MRRLILVSAVLFTSLTAHPAQALVIFGISQSAVPAGGSVALNLLQADIPIGLTGHQYLEALYPGGVIDISAADYAVQGFAFFAAAGSQEGSAFGTFEFSSLATINPTVVFTFENPGFYEISYGYGFTHSLELTGLVYDSEGEVIAGPFLGGPNGSESGFGTFQVRVGSVPEPSTWAMLLLGFAGLGALACQRRRRRAPLCPDFELR